MLDLPTVQSFTEKIAREAGALILGKQGTAQIAVQKGAHDFATEADIASETHIIAALRAAYPEHDILSEEAGSCRDTGSEYRWVIDPLDGTKNFYRGLPFWCVSIALQKNAQSIVGVVYAPVTQELWSARSGGGTTKNGVRVHIHPEQDTGDAVISISSPREHHGAEQQYERRIADYMEITRKFRNLRSLHATALELAHVSCGSLDAYMILTPGTKLWDTAAGTLLVQEAGGTVVNTTPRDAAFPISTVLAGNAGLVEMLREYI